MSFPTTMIELKILQVTKTTIPSTLFPREKPSAGGYRLTAQLRGDSLFLCVNLRCVLLKQASYLTFVPLVPDGNYALLVTPHQQSLWCNVSHLLSPFNKIFPVALLALFQHSIPEEIQFWVKTLHSSKLKEDKCLLSRLPKATRIKANRPARAVFS